MATRNKKNAKVNLLEVHDSDRAVILEKVKKQFKQTVAEAKLMHSLLQIENLTVNGNVVYKEDEQFTGFSIQK
ncbi:MAG: hypothetical protein QXV21_06235 [Candidatus Bathyarchaeia archaeon]